MKPDEENQMLTMHSTEAKRVTPIGDPVPNNEAAKNQIALQTEIFVLKRSLESETLDPTKELKYAPRKRMRDFGLNHFEVSSMVCLLGVTSTIVASLALEVVRRMIN